MKFLKQFLSELTQTGGRFGARDFDLNQTRGKHSSFLNFPFAKVCPPFVLLAAEVAARDETRRDGKRSRFHHSHSLSFPLSTFFPLSFYLLFPPTFFPPTAISSLSFPRLRRSSEVSQVRAFDLVGGRGESASNEPIAENLSSRARRDPTSHPPQSSSPAYVFSFYPLLSRLSWFYSRPLPPSFLARRHEGEGGRRWKASMRQESKDPRRIEEREPPFDHRFAAEKLLYSSRLMVNGHGFVHPFSSSTLAPRTGFLSLRLLPVDRPTISPINSRKNRRVCEN